MDLIAETSRLLIRPLSLDDLPVLSEILGNPEIMKYSVREVCDKEATRIFIERCLVSYRSHGIGPWALIEKKTSALIGFSGLGPEYVEDKEETNLGYRLARRYWGKGFATESVQAILAYAFRVIECGSVVAIIEPEHTASLRVAEKAGFSSFKEVAFHAKEVRLYRMTRDEWNQ